MAMKFVSVKELDELLNDPAGFQLIDVRESYEYEDWNLGGDNMPLDTVLSNKDKISKDKKVVFCCMTGKRSSAMTHTLERKFGMHNLYSLQGGLENYRESKL